MPKVLEKIKDFFSSRIVYRPKKRPIQKEPGTQEETKFKEKPQKE